MRRCSGGRNQGTNIISAKSAMLFGIHERGNMIDNVDSAPLVVISGEFSIGTNRAYGQVKGDDERVVPISPRYPVQELMSMRDAMASRNV